MLGHLKALAQRGEIPFVHCGFLAQAHDQRLLAMVSIIQIMDVAPLGGYLGAQPPKLSFLLTVVFAHAVRYTRRGKGLACLSASSRSARPVVHASRLPCRWTPQRPTSRPASAAGPVSARDGPPGTARPTLDASCEANVLRTARARGWKAHVASSPWRVSSRPHELRRATPFGAEADGPGVRVDPPAPSSAAHRSSGPRPRRA